MEYITITPKMREIYKVLETLLTIKETVSQQDVAIGMGFDMTRDIWKETTALIERGFIKKHGKRHSRDVHLTILRPLPDL